MGHLLILSASAMLRMRSQARPDFDTARLGWGKVLHDQEDVEVCTYKPVNTICLCKVLMFENELRFSPDRIACSFVNMVRRNLESVGPLPRFLHASSSCGHVLRHRPGMTTENVDARATVKCYILCSVKPTQEGLCF